MPRNNELVDVHPSNTLDMTITKSIIAAAVAAMSMLQAVPALAASCKADSGTTRAALVELYTSEGCSSCPPADQQLHKLTMAGPRVIPLALHVDYWDDIGWKDRYAQPSFTQRQVWEVEANRHRTPFTPHFFVNGREIEDWRSDLDMNLRASTQPSMARVAIVAEPQGAGNLHVKVDGTVLAAAKAHGPLQLFVVVTEGGLSSQVDAGENRGVRLEHDAVARNWIGPIAIQGNNAAFDRVLNVPQLSNGHVGVVAFIQDATTAEVLQAADTGVCKPS
jgi:hypothetical protein